MGLSLPTVSTKTLIWHTLCRTLLNTLPHLILPPHLWSGHYCYHLYFTDEEIEAQGTQCLPRATHSGDLPLCCLAPASVHYSLNTVPAAYQGPRLWTPREVVREHRVLSNRTNATNYLLEIQALKYAELESGTHNQSFIHRMAWPCKNNSAGQSPQRAWCLLMQWIKIYTLKLRCAEMEFNSHALGPSSPFACCCQASKQSLWLKTVSLGWMLTAFRIHPIRVRRGWT